MKKRVVSLLLVLLLVVSLLPMASFAADTGKVRVIVENTTLRQKEYTVNGQTFQVPWQDLLFDTEVNYKAGMTMDGALRAGTSQYLMNAADVNTVLQYEASEYGSYLIGVGGLLNWGTNAWMATLNDWFVDTGMDSVKVQPGDTVRVMYTTNYGADIGGDWSSTDVGLKDLSFDYGVLYPAFSHDVTEYTLYVPYDVDTVQITPTAANKNHKVFVTASDEKNVRWGARSVAVEAGKAEVTVDGGTAYTVNLVKMKDPPPPPTPIPDPPAPPTPTATVTPSAEPTTTPTPTPSAEPTTTPTPTVKNPFKDVAKDQYYYEPVLWAVNHNPQITQGTSATTFSPAATCTRGQVVTFLWRAAGEPKPTGTKNPFTDVKSGDYFYNAVLWAVEKGITQGTSKTTFSPNSPCTRAHVVTFLWRSEGQNKADAKNPFTDVKSGDYYYNAVLWAVKNGITQGTSKTTFSPANPCTRGQIVTFLWRDRAGAEPKAVTESVSDSAVVLAEEDPLTAVRRFTEDSSNLLPVCGESDWTEFDLFRNLREESVLNMVDYKWYYKTAKEKAEETNGKMDANYATDYARIVIAVTALGYNAADVAGYDLTARLSDVKYVTDQGTNGAIYALLALDSGDYVSYARPDYIQAILDAQLEDGGFTYMPDSPTDPDLTAMAIQALAPYLDQKPVASAVRKAVLCLSDMQQEDGGFFSWGASSCESTAQAIMAVETLKTQPGDHDYARNPKTLPALFNKTGGSLHDNLLTFQLINGSFCHVKDDPTTNGYATEQAMRALVAEECSALGVTLYGIR